MMLVSAFSPALLFGTPAGPTLLGVDVVFVATVLAGVAAMSVMLAIYAALTVRDPMAKPVSYTHLTLPTKA